MTDIIVPDMGESINSGILTTWLRKAGEPVQEGDNLFELETDKATLEVPATVAGLLHIAVDEGAEVNVGSVVGRIDESVKSSPKDSSPTKPKPAPKPPPTPTPAPAKPSPPATVRRRKKINPGKNPGRPQPGGATPR